MAPLLSWQAKKSYGHILHMIAVGGRDAFAKRYGFLNPHAKKAPCCTLYPWHVEIRNVKLFEF
jgi:hypothetical protein